MNTNSTVPMVSRDSCRQAGAERRSKELGIKLPTPPEPFGTYVEYEGNAPLGIVFE